MFGKEWVHLLLFCAAPSSSPYSLWWELWKKVPAEPHWGSGCWQHLSFFRLFYYSLSVSVCLSIDSLPNRQYDLDWTLMGGDFQFDPRLKRHRIFTDCSSNSPLYAVSQSKQKKNVLGIIKPKGNNKFHCMWQPKASHSPLFNSWPFIYWQYRVQGCCHCLLYRPVGHCLNWGEIAE